VPEIRFLAGELAEGMEHSGGKNERQNGGKTRVSHVLISTLAVSFSGSLAASMCLASRAAHASRGSFSGLDSSCK